MAEMKIGHSGKYPYVEINFSLDEEVENNSVKLRMSKMWYKDIIYEIEKVAEEEKKCAEKYFHEGNKKMLNHSFDIYLKISEIGQDLRRYIEMDSEVLTLREASGSL